MLLTEFDFHRRLLGHLGWEQTTDRKQRFEFLGNSHPSLDAMEQPDPIPIGKTSENPRYFAAACCFTSAIICSTLSLPS